MGRIKSPGLFNRNGIWHIDKQINGQRLRGSTYMTNLVDAERYLAKRVNDTFNAAVYGIRPERTFSEAATKFLAENQYKASIRNDIYLLKMLAPFIGGLSLKTVHMGSLQAFIKSRKQDGVKNRTINYGLQVIRRILNLAAGLWLDEHGLTWLDAAPKIVLLPENDKRKPYPLSWNEQEQLFNELPAHLRQMALFAVNTGCREAEICNLKWEWEVRQNNFSVFIVPDKQVKNREDRLVILNDIAKTVINERRGIDSDYVFTYQGHPIQSMNNSAWQDARKRAKLSQVRVHDLKHTFGRRLRAAGVSFEDRQDLLGHKSGRITTHYSAAEINNLIEAANKVCSQSDNSPTLVLLKSPHYPHNGNFAGKVKGRKALKNMELAMGLEPATC